jgi:hypothetical protein
MIDNGITLVCVFNNKYLLDHLLLTVEKTLSLKYKIQYFLIDNTKNIFKSAAQAYNSISKLIIYPYVVFTHQDIELNSSKFIDEAILYLIQNPYSIIGVAGALNSKIVSNMTHGPNKISAGRSYEKPINVQTVDECFFITTNSVINSVKFDENTCNGWHLYATDLCLSSQKHFVKSLVLPSSSSIYHKSLGKIDLNFFYIMKKIQKKHKQIKQISTTCITIKDDYFSTYFYLNLKIIQFKLSRFFFRK